MANDRNVPDTDKSQITEAGAVELDEDKLDTASGGLASREYDLRGKGIPKGPGS